MNEINNELLAKFEGQEWRNTEPVQYGFYILNPPKRNPSYSTSPADQKRLLEYLMGKEE
jgi:hypothetical protein